MFKKIDYCDESKNKPILEYLFGNYRNKYFTIIKDTLLIEK